MDLVLGHVLPFKSVAYHCRLVESWHLAITNFNLGNKGSGGPAFPPQVKRDQGAIKL